MRAAHTQGHGTEHMIGYGGSCLESQHLIGWGGGAISMRKELEQKGKKTVVGQAAGSVVMMRFQSPPSIASCVLSGECGVCTGWKIDFQLLAIRIHQVRAEWERGWLFIC